MLKTLKQSVFLWATIYSFSLVACSNGELTAERQPHDERREFGAEEKRAARALSISNTEIVANAESPYARALLCRHGLTEMAGMMRETWSLSSEQEQALRHAEAMLDERLRELAGAEGKSSEGIQEDLEQTAQNNRDQARNVRMAVGCIEQLQQG